MKEHLRKMKSFEDLEYFIKRIMEYGPKTGGLLLKIICDSNLCSFKENIKSIPIDRHDIEISYLTGVILDKNIKDKETKKLSDAYVKIGKEL